MTREDYLRHRWFDIVSPTLFYAYYLEHKHPDDAALSITEFQKYFTTFLAQVGLPYPQVAAKVKAYYDKKFHVSILRSKEGHVLKIY